MTATPFSGACRRSGRCLGGFWRPHGPRLLAALAAGVLLGGSIPGPAAAETARAGMGAWQVAQLGSLFGSSGGGAAPGSETPGPEASGQGEARDEAIDEAIRAFADELVAGLSPRPAGGWGFPPVLGSRGNDGTAPRRIAIWPRWQKQSHLPESLAERLSSTLLYYLRSSTDAQGFQFMARDDLRSVIQEIEEFDTSTETYKRVTALVEEAGADILVVASVLPRDAGSVWLDYRAVDVRTGEILTNTRPRALAHATGPGDALHWESSVREAAEQLVRAAGEMGVVRPQGIKFQNSGVQTPFGNYYTEVFVTEMLRRYGEVRSGARVRVAQPELRERGTDTLLAADVDAALTSGADNDYLFSGTYWDLGDRLDMQLQLRNGSGHLVAWRGMISRASLPPTLEVAPSQAKAVEEARRNDGLGPIGLKLASNKGHDPVYRLGEHMVLLVEADREAHLHCFYRQADGTMIRIFPYRDGQLTHVAGKRINAIPDPADGIAFRVSEPTGVEQLKCIAVDRDIMIDLPRLLHANFEPLPYDGFEALAEVFRRIDGLVVSEASLVVTIER